MPMMMDESAAEFLQNVTAYEVYIDQKYDTPSLKLSAYQKLVRDIATGNWQQNMFNNDFLGWRDANGVN